MIANILGLWQDGMLSAPDVPRNTARTLRLVRGESATLRLRVVNPAGVPFSLIGATVTLSARYGTMSTERLFPAKLGTALTADGTCEFLLLPADTRTKPSGRYVYDVWVSKGSEAQAVVPVSAFVLEPSVFNVS